MFSAHVVGGFEPRSVLQMSGRGFSEVFCACFILEKERFSHSNPVCFILDKERFSHSKPPMF
jgi:hypothetical protein